MQRHSNSRGRPWDSDAINDPAILRRALNARVRLALSVLLAAGLLVALLHAAGSQAWSGLTAAPARVWLIVVVGLCGSYAFRALRVHAEWRNTAGVGFAECLAVSLLHNGAVNLLPLRGGELAYPWLLHRRWGVPLRHAAFSLLWMRVQDAIVLGTVAWLLWGPLALPLRATLAATGLTLLFGVLPAGLRRCLPALPQWLASVLRQLMNALDAARRQTSGWVYSAAHWALKLLALGTMLAALAGVPSTTAIAAALGGELAAVLPLQGPAGLGTYEAGVWVGAGLIEPVAPSLVGAALAVHACSWGIAILAAGLAGWRRSSLRLRATPELSRAQR